VTVEVLNAAEASIVVIAARLIGGVLYRLIIAAGVFAEALVRNRLVVPGHAAATSRTIRLCCAPACYLTTSAYRSSPRLASILFPSVLVPAFIGELLFVVCLTVKAGNVARWQKAAHSTASS
jgi:hypothetical protein